MKRTFTNLETTRLAYNEVSLERTSNQLHLDSSELQMLKRMQNIVDQCLLEPSQLSIDKILSALKSF